MPGEGQPIGGAAASAQDPIGNLRVLHVAEVLAGGIASYLNEVLPWQARQLAPGGLILICPAGEIGYLSSEARKVVTLRTFVRTGRTPMSLLRLWRAVWRARADLRPDVVHAHSSFAGATCRLQFRCPQRDTVYTPHGWAMAMEVPTFYRRAFAFVEQFLARRCRAIIAVSRHELDVARRWGLPQSKLKLVVSGLGPAAERARIGPCSERLELLFVGRWDRQKGLDWLLAVMAGLPSGLQVRLRVAGAAVVGSSQSVRAWPANVEPLGWLSPGQLDTCYDAADALVIPSRWEALGLVALEAMRRGVAVLASDRGALPEVVEDGVTGHVFSLERPNELSGLLMRLDRKQLGEMGARGRERFHNRFAAERMNREIFDLYRAMRVNPAEAGNV